MKRILLCLVLICFAFLSSCSKITEDLSDTVSTAESQEKKIEIPTIKSDDQIIAASCKSYKFIGDTGNHRHQCNSHHNSQNGGFHSDKQEKNDADHHNHQQEACSAASVLFGSLAYIFRNQFPSVFDAIDTLVLRTMISEHPLNIFHT